MSKVANKIVSVYRILSTKFYQNEKIVDGDIDGLLEIRNWQDIGLYDFVTEIDADDYPVLQAINSESISLFSKEWIQTIKKSRKEFNLALIRPGKKSDQQIEYLLVVASNAIVDEVSCSFAAREILSLYSRCHQLRAFGTFDADIMEFIDSYQPKESVHYPEHSDETKFGMF